MSRQIFQLVAALSVAIGFTNGAIHAEEPFAEIGKVSNGALVYWQAFALLPEVSEVDSQLIREIEKGTKELEKAKPILARSERALHLAINVKPNTPCRWGVVQDGPNTMLPHLSKARLLARLMVLQARLDAKAGNDSAAVENMANALLVARNIDTGVLVHTLVGDAIESIVLDAAEPLLPNLDKAALGKLSSVLANLPARPTLGETLGYERDIFGGWIRPIIVDDGAAGVDKITKSGIGVDSKQIAKVFGGTKEVRKKRVDELFAAYDKMIEAVKLPKAEAEAKLEQLSESVAKSTNPLVRLFMPTADSAYARHTEVSDRVAKFEKDLSERVKAGR